MSLFLKLQKRVTELEQEKQVMQDELDRKEEQVLRSKAKVRSATPPQGRAQTKHWVGLSALSSLMETQPRSTLSKQHLVLVVRAELSSLFSAE